MVRISPSLMCMDLTQFSKQINVLNQAIDYFHVDIMDGHYVKNMTLSPWFIGELKKVSRKPIEAHLMVNNPSEYVIPLLELETDIISIHAEHLTGQAFRLLHQIKDAGKQFGVVINPETAYSTVEDFIHHIDILTVMTVDPGFAGQKFVEESLKKIRFYADLKEAKGYNYQIQIDGSCNKKTYLKMLNAGAEILVVGSSGLFGLDENIEKALEQMSQDINEAVEKMK